MYVLETLTSANETSRTALDTDARLSLNKFPTVVWNVPVA